MLTPDDPRPIVVTGYSRCGSSMTMRMLYEGGVEVYAENKSSFETTKVHDLPERSDWLDEVGTRAFKLLEPMHFLLPFNRQYRFIALTRDADHQAESHSYFLRKLGSLAAPMTRSERRGLAAGLRKDNARLPSWLRKNYPGSIVLTFSFEEILSTPLNTAATICANLAPQLQVTLAADVVIQRPPKVMKNDLLIEHASSMADDYNLPISVVWARLKARYCAEHRA